MSQLIWREGRLPGVDSLEWLVWSVTVIGLAWGMSRPLLNFAGRALPVDEVMRLSRSPQVWANA